MPSLRDGLFLFVALAAVQLTSAQTIVNSVFTPRNTGYYSDASNWSPPEVPNNTPEKSYNITIPAASISMNIDATVSNVTLDSATIATEGEGRTFTVTGTTTIKHTSSQPVWDFFLTSQTASGPTFRTGSLSSFSGGALSGWYYLSNYNISAGWVTLQFNGARITALSDAQLWLAGPFTRIVDELGNDALRDLARIDSDARLGMVGHQMVVAGPLTNQGALSVAAGFGQPGLFSITGELTNFDVTSRTLTSGAYSVGGNNYTESDHPAVFQFAGADIVHNGASLGIYGPLAKITDENGNDALRNFSHNTATGVFSVGGRDFSIAGNFTNDGVLSLGGTFTIEGSLTNFDAPTRTLASGTYQLGSVRFVFSGADIVDNAASIYLVGGGKIVDENGNDALRNFTRNLKGGQFTINDYYIFTAAADFTNAGVVNILGAGDISRSHFTVPEGHRYTQTEGETSLLDANFTGEIEILGGSFTTAGNPYFGNPAFLDGDLTIDDALFVARSFTVHGAVGLSARSRLLTRPEQYAYFSVNETFTAGGALQIAAPQSTPSSTETFSVVQASGGVVGTFSNAPPGRRISTVDGRGSFVVSYTPNSISLSGFQPTPATAQLLNISTRLPVETGDDVLIGGFIVSGTQMKKVIVRAIGPSLPFGSAGVLADPILELRDSSGALIASNDNWRSDQEADIIATGIPPGNDLESAIVANLPANNSAYTAIVRGKNNGTGVGLVEVYDLAPTLDSRPVNISTRGLVQFGDNVLISGLIVLGQNPMRIIVRAIGPSLPLSAPPLGDPTLSLYDGNGALIAFNDNWRSDQEAEIIATGIPPSNNLESAIIATLPANGGAYTAIVRGNNDASGVALVEVYDLN